MSAPVDTKALRAKRALASPGTWRWNVNLASRQVYLECTGRGRGLEYVMTFERWGMNGAAPLFRNEQDLMVRADELTAIVPGREHHERWYRTLRHPDAEWMVAIVNAAPALLDEVDALRDSRRALERANLEATCRHIDAELAGVCHQCWGEGTCPPHTTEQAERDQGEGDSCPTPVTSPIADTGGYGSYCGCPSVPCTRCDKGAVLRLTAERDALSARVAELERAIEGRDAHAMLAGVRVLANPVVERGTVMMNPADLPPRALAQAEEQGAPKRCEVCGWTLAESRENGCVNGDCSYRPDTGSAEWHRIRARREELAARDASAMPTNAPALPAIEESTFDSTAVPTPSAEGSSKP